MAGLSELAERNLFKLLWIYLNTSGKIQTHWVKSSSFSAEKWTFFRIQIKIPHLKKTTDRKKWQSRNTEELTRKHWSCYLQDQAGGGEEVGAQEETGASRCMRTCGCWIRFYAFKASIEREKKSKTKLKQKQLGSTKLYVFHMWYE